MTSGTELPAAPHFLPEVFIMAVVNAISELVGAELEGCHVEFAFQPTMPPDVYESFIGLPVRFGKDGNRFIGPRDAVNLPLAAAHNEVAEIFVRQCSMLLVEKNGARNHTMQVRRILLNSKRKISCEHAVAQQLNMSGRTLRRRLSDEETSFREIYDELRKEMATAYLTETRISIAEIGSLLGFDDVANFRRAFRRWNDCSPQQFRAAQGTDAFLEVVDIERRFQEAHGAMQ
jgi:AraC-like DNA-binding protein